MTHTPAPVLFDGTDTEYPTCPTCGQAWKVAHRAHDPHAIPVDPPTPDRPTYRVVGCTATLTVHPDTGDHRILMTWPCDGHTMTIAYPAVDLLPCLTADGHPCKGGQPLDPGKTGWGHVHRCRCCNHAGAHWVRRDGLHPPTCRAALSPTNDDTEETR